MAQLALRVGVGGDSRDEWQRSRTFLSPWERPLGAPSTKLAAIADRTQPLSVREAFENANLVALHLCRYSRFAEARALLGLQSHVCLVQRHALVWSLDSHLNRTRLLTIQGRQADALHGYADLINLCLGTDHYNPLPLTRRDLLTSALTRTDLVQALRSLRNSVTADVCRLYWRAGLLAELAASAHTFRELWPNATGAGFTFPTETETLMRRSEQWSEDQVNNQDAVVLRLHAASHASWSGDTRLALQIFEMARDDLEKHTNGCPGCCSCIDWSADLARTASVLHLTKSTETLSEDAVTTALAIDDHGTLSRLASLPLRQRLSTELARQESSGRPESNLLTQATEQAGRRLLEIK